jgi:hypothetical protein
VANIKVDDWRVKKVIREQLAHAPGNNVIDVLKNAWKRTLLLRGSPTKEWNAVYAAAEHYLYMRLLAAITGDPICTRAAPYIYEGRKVAKFIQDAPEELQIDKHPLMPPSFDIAVWGERGAKDGVRDFFNMNHHRALGAACSGLASDAKKIAYSK